MDSVATIVAVCGLPGSGKSYFAARLAGRMEAAYISSDEVRKQMFAVRTYSDEEKLSVYRKMTDLAAHAVVEAKDVVLDATFYRQEIRDLVAKALEPPLRWIEVRADEFTIRERLTKPRIHSEADYKVYLKIRDKWEPLTGEYLRLQSTNDNIDEMLEQAMQYLHDDQ